MSNNLLSACADMINATLKIYECNLESTYDYSSVIIRDSEDNSHVVKGSNIYTLGYGYNWQEEYEEEMIAHKKDFEVCKAEILLLIAKFNCKLDTTYDMSHVLIFDKYGNTSKI